MQYPANIAMAGTGCARIHQGHGLDPDVLAADLSDNLGRPLPDQQMRVRELHFGYAPRVKWCEQYGLSCDREGEWHSHWYEVKPSPDSAFTVVEWQRVLAEQLT
ncbi:hypothetical protein [Mycolicibacterium sp.]|uniref:hypothetical protein n=1 Tax=Mycolicibacterium sp. TaxID=2320850 RepID=UPI0037CC9136